MGSARVPPTFDHEMPVTDPRPGELLGREPHSTREDADRALQEGGLTGAAAHGAALRRRVTAPGPLAGIDERRCRWGKRVGQAWPQWQEAS